MTEKAFLDFIMALAIQMVASLFATEGLKIIFKIKGGRMALVMSWAIGAGIMYGLHSARVYDATPMTWSLFIVMAGMLSVAYKEDAGRIKTFVRWFWGFLRPDTPQE